jgi:cytochrome c peroxidase
MLSLDYFIMPSSNDFVNLPNQDPHNPITAEKVELGQMLFFETGLAQTPLKEDSYETYSCSSCHIPSKGFLP